MGGSILNPGNRIFKGSVRQERSSVSQKQQEGRRAEGWSMCGGGKKEDRPEWGDWRRWEDNGPGIIVKTSACTLDMMGAPARTGRARWLNADL